MIHRFILNEVSYFGPGARKMLPQEIKRLGLHKALVATDKELIRFGVAQKVLDVLEEAGVPYELFSEIKPNPTVSNVKAGVKAFSESGADFILAIGGGSSIDTAKAIAAGVPYEGDFWDFYIGKAQVARALKVAVVLTIPAAGSEGSGNTVITKVDSLQKMSLRAPMYLRPVFSILNPELTYTLPPFQTACGVCDMMIHVFERYFTNTTDVEISDRMCEGVLMSIVKEAYRVKQDPQDYGARANLMWAGMVAHNGTCGVGCEEDWASHFLEHEVSALYNVAHGAGLAVIVPAWMTFMAEHHPRKVAQLGHRLFGVPEQEDLQEMAQACVSRLKHFFRYMGLPVSFRELGVEHPDIPLLVRKLHENKGPLVGNYVKLTPAYSEEIYRLAL